MSRYVMEFSKTGTVCYISHLDLMRFFHRAFKRAGVRLAYSQGFNPHPKIGFAQPLSLGYRGLEEYIELETAEEYEPVKLEEMMKPLMPEGLEIHWCRRLENVKKTLAAITDEAEYTVRIPLRERLSMTDEEMRQAYLGQESISAWRKQKKKKELKEIDIRPMIRDAYFTQTEEEGETVLKLDLRLDSGSVSNLSPELVIETATKFLGIESDRSEMDVTRKAIHFTQKKSEMFK